MKVGPDEAVGVVGPPDKPCNVTVLSERNDLGIVGWERGHGEGIDRGKAGRNKKKESRHVEKWFEEAIRNNG